MIDRYHYWARPLGLRRMMDRLFEDAFVLPRGAEQPQPSGHTLNVYEEGDQLVVEARLPGFKPEDIDLSVDRGILTIRAQAKAEDERQERSYVVREHRTSSFVRSLRLPETVDADAATATYQHGVLKLAFPKTEPARPRRVQIATSGQGALGSASGAQPDAETSAPSAQPAAEQPAATMPAHHDDRPTEPAPSKAASPGTNGKASRRKTAERKGTGRKAAEKEAVGAGA